MAYTVKLSVHNHFGDDITVVEKTCWMWGGGGTWTEEDGHHILSMGSSGTSGMLRFKSTKGELFALAIGVHNHTPWCDLLVNLRNVDTNTETHRSYHGGSRDFMVSSGLRTLERSTATGRSLGITFSTSKGHSLAASLVSATSVMDKGSEADEPLSPDPQSNVQPSPPQIPQAHWSSFKVLDFSNIEGERPPTSISFSSASSLLATGAQNSPFIRVWDIEAGTQRKKTSIVFSGEMRGVTFALDDQSIWAASKSSDGSARGGIEYWAWQSTDLLRLPLRWE